MEAGMMDCAIVAAVVCDNTWGAITASLVMNTYSSGRSLPCRTRSSAPHCSSVWNTLGRRIFLDSIRLQRCLQAIVEVTICHRRQLIFGDCLDHAKYGRGLVVPRHLNRGDAIHVGRAVCDHGLGLHGNTHAKYIETQTRCASNDNRCLPKFQGDLVGQNQFSEGFDIYRDALPASWFVGTFPPILRRAAAQRSARRSHLRSSIHVLSRYHGRFAVHVQWARLVEQVSAHSQAPQSPKGSLTSHAKVDSNVLLLSRQGADLWHSCALPRTLAPMTQSQHPLLTHGDNWHRDACVAA